MTEATKAARAVRQCYDRFAPLYDFIEGIGERTIGPWRKILWSKVEGERILEIGVGTGRNIPYYPVENEITAFDFSGRMLSRAVPKVANRAKSISLLLMDGQSLAFKDDTFDTVMASLVFCSVPEPISGLREAARVVKPGGKVVLLEHVISSNPLQARLMDWLNPLVLRLCGDNMNRKTVENVAKSGLTVEKVTDLSDIFKLIEARKA